MRLIAHLLGAQLACTAALGQDAIQCRSDLPGPNNCYRIYAPASAPRGLVVLLPGFGEPPDYFDRTGLPGILTARGVLVVGLGMAGYLIEEDVETLHAVVSRIAAEREVPEGALVIGGVSAGGTGSLLYAERCARGGCDARVRPAAAFTVDAPLDLERWWNAQELTIRRLGEAIPDGDRFETGAILEALRGSLGGSPRTHRAVYVERSPFSATEPDGGNARLLADTPLRAYAEPDIVWTIENWRRDYLTMNWVDQAGLVLELQLLGNEHAQLVTTSGRGFRNGRRSPHSWTIVDEHDLAGWIDDALAGTMRHAPPLSGP